MSECPNVVRLEKVLGNDKYIVLVMEYCDGDMADYVRSKGEDEGLDEVEARKIMKQLMDAMMHLHKNKVVHRDLKLDNILLKQGTDKKWSAKLGDFGQARRLKHTDEIMRGFYGNQGTITPEMLELRRVRQIGEPKPPGYNYKVDIWAIGSVFYWLLTGSPPFDKYETVG